MEVVLVVERQQHSKEAQVAEEDAKPNRCCGSEGLALSARVRFHPTAARDC